MITLEQAKALKDGDVVWSLNTLASGFHYTRWTVYTPSAEGTWNDKAIVKYLKGTFGVKGYIFATQLHIFYLSEPETKWSNTR